MTASFAVIIQQRQHFGDKADAFSQFPFGVTIDDFGGGTVPSQAGSAPFVGPQKDFSFDCPGVDRSETSVLMFQSLGVQHEGNLIAVNPDTIDQPTVFGGIPVIPAVSGALPTWSANVMLVRPAALFEAGNVLRIRSRPLAGGVASELDDFVIDNVVLMYSTRTSSGGTQGPI
jgi:hypothetical protein